MKDRLVPFHAEKGSQSFISLGVRGELTLSVSDIQSPTRTLFRKSYVGLGVSAVGYVDVL